MRASQDQDGHHGRVGIGAFARVLGDVVGKPEDVPDFDALWQAASPGAEFATMGCGTFRKMSGPVDGYVVESIRRTLKEQEVAAAEVDRVIFATSDALLGDLGPDFAARVLRTMGMSSSVPLVLSYQQCCSSLAALSHGWELLRDERVAHVVLVFLDYTRDDRERIRPFALFSDAVTSCLISRARAGTVRLLASAVHTDEAGLRGEDSFASRQQAARAVLSEVFEDSGRGLQDVAKVFPTNLYWPVTVFNAAAAGITREKLHFADTLRSYGHCGNSDWLINLADHQDRVGIRPATTYLAQASAPGFFAGALLEGV